MTLLLNNRHVEQVLTPRMTMDALEAAYREPQGVAVQVHGEARAPRRSQQNRLQGARRC